MSVYRHLNDRVSSILSGFSPFRVRCGWAALIFVVGLSVAGHRAVAFIPFSPTLRFEQADGIMDLKIGTTSEGIDDGAPVVIRSKDKAQVSETAPPKSESESSWKFQWMGWDGIDFEIQETTSFKNPSIFDAHGKEVSYLSSKFSVERLTFHARIGIRTDVDATHMFETGNSDGSSTRLALRRFRILTKGDFQFLFPYFYQIELGYVPTAFYVENMYIAMRDLRWVGELKFGQFTAPMGFDALASSRWVTFMEEASPSEAFAPGVNLGLQMHRTFRDDNMVLTAGFFSDAVTSDTGDASQDYGRLIGRLSWISGWEEGPATDEPEHLTHWGVAMNTLYSTSDSVRYRSRPEARSAGFLIDTGDMKSNWANTAALEYARVDGARLLQGEAFYSRVRRSDDVDESDLGFYGGYVVASWILTGERRRYIKKNGVFGGVRPNTVANWKNKWGGALEVSARISYTSLSDGSIDGGRMFLAGGGLTWYLQERLRFKANILGGQVRRFSRRDNILLIEFRISTDLGP